MALFNLFTWAEKKDIPASSCGSACGSSDKPAEQPTACGAEDKPKKQPASCGSACGAGDNK